jgi:predicted ATP-grasp superfamily ATP-dependent carboligase
MSAVNNGMPTVLVTDAARGSAIAIIRSLGRRGWRVIAGDSQPRSPGFHSRYARGRLVYPSPEEAPAACIDALVQAARDRHVDLIVPVTDAVILPMSAARDRFDGVSKLALPGADGLEVATDKLKTLELAERLAVPVPGTFLASTAAQACEKAKDSGWPLVLKPQASRLYREQSGIESFRVCYAENIDRLATRMRPFEGRCPVLVQEYTPGDGYGVELLMHHGRPLAAFQHKRLRELPTSGGPSAFRESVPLDPVLYRHSVRLLEAIDWTGLAMVEFKVGADGPKLMEINGRVWGSLPLATHSGMDFPARMAELFLYGPPAGNGAPDTGYRVGVRARDLELETMWIVAVLAGKRRYPFLPMPPRRQGLAALVELLNPAYKFDILSWDDPRPGMAEIPKIVRKLGSKLIENVSGE